MRTMIKGKHGQMETEYITKTKKKKHEFLEMVEMIWSVILSAVGRRTHVDYIKEREKKSFFFLLALI